MRHIEGVKEPRREYWSRTIAEQASSGLSIRGYCKQAGISDQSFYAWRRRLGQGRAVHFAELKTITGSATASAIEILLTTGERLRIPNGVESATLRLVLEALRP